jgi:hypothetical protein
MKELNETTYDVIARSWKNEVVFEAGTKKGADWIQRHWFSDTFQVGNLLSAAVNVRTMNADGLSVVLLCGV